MPVALNIRTDVWRSQFEVGQAYAPMYGSEDTRPNGVFEYRIDKVMASGQCVGWSSDRIMSWYYRKIISLAAAGPVFAQEGTEVMILWGDPDKCQKLIRARCPLPVHGHQPQRER